MKQAQQTKEDLVAQLVALRRRVEEAKRNRAQVEGKLGALLERLKKEHGCRTLVEAQAKQRKLQAEEAKLVLQVEAGIEDVEALLA